MYDYFIVDVSMTGRTVRPLGITWVCHLGLNYEKNILNFQLTHCSHEKRE